MASRTARSAWSLGAGLAFTGVTTLTGLLCTPLLLKWLGSERFGVYRTLVDILAYLTLLDLGFGAALGASLAAAQGRGDSARVSELVAAGLKRYVRIGVGMLAAAGALIAMLPRLIPVRQLAPWELTLAGAISLVPILFLPTSVYRSLLEARQAGYVVQSLQIAQSVTTTIFLLLAAWLQWGLPGQAAANSLAMILAQLSFFYFATQSGKRFDYKTPRRELISQIGKLQWPSLVYVFTGRIGLLSDNIIVASMLSPQLVVPFYLTQRLATLAATQLQQVGNATWAGLVELHAQGMRTQFQDRLFELTAMVSGAAFAILGPIAAFNHHFIRLWVGPGNDAGAGVILLCCANSWFLALFTLWTWPVTGVGLIAKLLPIQIPATVLNVVVSIAATKYIGLEGPLIGTIAGFLVVSSWGFARLLSREMGVSASGLWNSAAMQLWWGLPYFGALWIISHSIGSLNLVPASAMASLSILGGFGLWWSFGLTSSARTHWRSRLSLVFA